MFIGLDVFKTCGVGLKKNKNKTAHSYICSDVSAFWFLVGGPVIHSLQSTVTVGNWNSFCPFSRCGILITELFHARIKRGHPLLAVVFLFCFFKQYFSSPQMLLEALNEVVQQVITQRCWQICSFMRCCHNHAGNIKCAVFFFKETYYGDFYIVFFNSTVRFIRWHAWIPNVTEWLTCLMYYLWCASWFKSQKSRLSNTCHFNKCQHDNLTLYGLYVGGSHLFLWRGVSDGLKMYIGSSFTKKEKLEATSTIAA